LEVALGDFVLSGGELAAAVVIDAVARLLPGVLGDENSHVQDSYTAGLLDCPQYTRPEIADGMTVPAVLLGGDHAAIRRWRLKEALGRTWLKRPRLIAERELSGEESELLAEFKAERVNSDGELA
jgi:tRNA (guanine37-N1)-methyltransferase